VSRSAGKFFLTSGQLLTWARNSLPFMELEDLLRCSKGHNTDPILLKRKTEIISDPF
jgi:hypothetical protein